MFCKVFENGIIWPFRREIVAVKVISALDLIVITDRMKGRNELRKFQECCGMNKQIYTSKTSGKHLYEHYSLYEMN
ncbi:hypothetical protein T02_12260 [Trichinella nativa]|uniref:Uncharacterized protein n=1 Tax=Trichinella nativa TaxID=6335 RepID=A0A0V1KR90_9BILA|nr:hypothetical protein T02_12260 [Trichinella nativa]